jgi:hypothetical protein
LEWDRSLILRRPLLHLSPTREIHRCLELQIRWLVLPAAILYHSCSPDMNWSWRGSTAIASLVSVPSCYPKNLKSFLNSF